MSAQRAGEFFARADSDPVIKDRVVAVRSGEELLAIARAEGFVFEMRDLEAFVATSSRVYPLAGIDGGRLLLHCRALFGSGSAAGSEQAGDARGGSIQPSVRT